MGPFFTNQTGESIMSLNHVRVSGVRTSGKDGGGLFTASCDVHYPDGSIALVATKRPVRFTALRALVTQVKTIDEAESPTGKLRKALLLNQNDAA